ncbi:flagellar hook-length control protein FliK [Sphingomonas sp. GC_Shp_3]|uniref:flagellar hook-length control protein FliK n=1 Tax=Sphingomonas sp. GC_Shp_3 TaxID=2937383 RepID=UPI00226AF7C3|nr:flagellar hook-length control protein FliK [Sphingomonas sp. GC_Shp_3]
MSALADGRRAPRGDADGSFALAMAALSGGDDDGNLIALPQRQDEADGGKDLPGIVADPAAPAMLESLRWSPAGLSPVAPVTISEGMAKPTPAADTPGAPAPVAPQPAIVARDPVSDDTGISVSARKAAVSDAALRAKLPDLLPNARFTAVTPAAVPADSAKPAPADLQPAIVVRDPVSDNTGIFVSARKAAVAAAAVGTKLPNLLPNARFTPVAPAAVPVGFDKPAPAADTLGAPVPAGLQPAIVARDPVLSDTGIPEMAAKTVIGDAALRAMPSDMSHAADHSAALHVAVASQGQPQPARGATPTVAVDVAALGTDPTTHEDRKKAAADTIVPQTGLTTEIALQNVLQPTGDTRHVPLDLGDDTGLPKMIDHIETLRDDADANDTHIGLAPEALGGVDVAVRRSGDAVHVQFTTKTETTRALLTEAQPRLVELADQRGVRIAGASVDSGTDGTGSESRRQSQPQRPASPSPLDPRLLWLPTGLLPNAPVAPAAVQVGIAKPAPAAGALGAPVMADLQSAIFARDPVSGGIGSSDVANTAVLSDAALRATPSDLFRAADHGAALHVAVAPVAIQAQPQPARGAMPTVSVDVAALGMDPIRHDDRKKAAADPIVLQTGLTTEVALRNVVQPTGETRHVPLDLRGDTGLQKMIDHIETLRDDANANDTHIRLVPDALGGVDVAVRRSGDAVHVHFTAETEATRALLTEAQPRLVELADQRGVRIAGATVDSGTGGAGSGSGQQPQPQRQAPATANVFIPTTIEGDGEDARLA